MAGRDEFRRKIRALIPGAYLGLGGQSPAAWTGLRKTDGTTSPGRRTGVGRRPRAQPASLQPTHVYGRAAAAADRKASDGYITGKRGVHFAVRSNSAEL